MLTIRGVIEKLLWKNLDEPATVRVVKKDANGTVTHETVLL